MAVDKSYGSGKSRSAANSSARRRVAAGKLTKSKPKTGVTLNKVAKAAGNVVDFAFNGPKEIQGKYSEVGVSPLKILQAARALVSAGRAAEAAPLFARVAAKVGGRVAKKASAKGNAGRGPFSMKNAFKEQSAVSKLTSGKTGSVTDARRASESLYPKLPSRGGDAPSLLRGQRDIRSFDKYADPINEGAGRFARGTSRGNKLVRAIEKNEVQQGFYIGSREAIKRAAFNSTRRRSNLPKAK